MSYDFKRLGEVPEVEEVPEDSKVLINDEDEIKQIAFEKIAHASGGGAIPCLCIYEDNSGLTWKSNVPIIEVQNAIANSTPVLVYGSKLYDGAIGEFNLMIYNGDFESWEGGFYISPKFITENTDGVALFRGFYIDINYSSSDDTEGTWEYD